MSGLKVSVVKFVNAFPFLYGLTEKPPAEMSELTTDVPSECARKVMSGEADIGLIPVAVTKKMESFYIAGDYCVGAVGPVFSVALYSNDPVERIKTIHLDVNSRSSAALLRVLVREKWKINPEWIEDVSLPDQFIGNGNAALVIGDRTFSLEGKFQFKYDLAEAWLEYTKLPFVFACFVSKRPLSVKFVEQLNESMRYGVENLSDCLDALLPEQDLKDKNMYLDYLKKNVSYPLDSLKRQGMELFLSKIQ
ncbi:MAG: menaquinone biosynthesis protein [Bacteroidota bacterium]